MLFTTDKNTLTCYGRIFPSDGVEFMYFLERLEKEYEEIHIHLHTYGGSVVDGNLIYNSINKSTAKVVITVDGLAASMGSVIIMATPYVKIVENGYIMIHAPSGGVMGKSKDLKSYAKLLESMEANFKAKLKERTGKSDAELNEWMQTDNWFDAQEAVDLGLASEVIDAETKTPVTIEEPEDFGEEEVFNAYASLMTANTNNQSNQVNMNIKQMIITAFALEAVTADSSDTAIVEKLKSIFEAKKNEVTAAEQAKADALKELSDFKENQVKQVVEAYAKDNKLSEDKKSIYMKIGKTSGIDALQTVLQNSEDKAPNIHGMINGGSSADAKRADWDWDKWQKEDPRGLEKLAQENPEAYKELFNQKYNK